ncbi:tetratricopeptide repeat protein [Foetidibacter luteolus]|uniref:tetratricopeptide repeat protein n=1 Tax=Foetidibacter luteolus TaxID=2608880 RepID=UPI00129BD5A7|nr:tetratricopeptide repeat protein [Foetidibacter luteolus]
MIGENRHIARARLLLGQGRLKDAEKEVGYALQQDPNDHEAMLLLAECKIDAKDYDAGISLLQQAILLDPHSDRPYYLLGFAHYQKDNLKEATKQLDIAIQLNPYHAGYFGLYAYIYMEQHNYKAALEKANEGLNVDPEELTCLNARSQALFRLKSSDEAYETIKEALSIDPDNAFTHTNYGWHFLEKGKHKQAREHFREALRIEPTMGRARAGLKESLKANVPPYRWLLMFSLWLSSKSKAARWGIIIALWIGVRLATSASKSAGWQVLAFVLAALYLAFVVFSWIGNSLANLYLSFHKEGKYALTSSEKYNAWSIGGVILLSIIFFTLNFTTGGKTQGALFFCSIVVFSLAMPLSQLQYPISFVTRKPSFWMAFALIGLGVCTCLSAWIAPAVFTVFLSVYMLAFLVYTWAGSFSGR